MNQDSFFYLFISLFLLVVNCLNLEIAIINYFLIGTTLDEKQ